MPAKNYALSREELAQRVLLIIAFDQSKAAVQRELPALPVQYQNMAAYSRARNEVADLMRETPAHKAELHQAVTQFVFSRHPA